MTGVSQKSSMWNLSDNLDEVFSGPISTDEIVAEKLDLFKRLFGKKLDKADHYQDYDNKHNYKDESDKDTDAENSYEEYGIEDDDDPIEVTKASHAPTKHIKSYAVARGKGYLRVAVDGDKSLTKARLHIFKKGSRYFGFLTIPGPGRKAESFREAMDVVLYESASDIVLKYDSNDLEDLFNLANYTKRSSLESDKFSQYEDEVDILDQDTAEKANIGRLPWGKQRRQEVSGETPDEIDEKLINQLSEKYQNIGEEQTDKVYSFMFRSISEFISNIKTKSQAEFIMNNIKKAIEESLKKGDERSLKKADIYENVLDDLLSIVNLVEV